MLLLCYVSCNKQHLFPICEKDRFGYINQKGERIIDPYFYWADEFSEGLAAVSDGLAFGFIDTKGHIVIPYQFLNVGGPFNGGIAPIITLDGKHGYVNRDGKVFAQGISKISFHPDSEGLLKFDKDNKFGFVDTNGNIVIEPQFDDISEFSEGLAAVKLNNYWGYINKSGKIVIKCRFEKAKDFKQGLAPVKVFGQWGFIDKKGKLVIKGQYRLAYCFSDGLAAVAYEKTGIGYINKKGKLIIGCKYSYGGDFKKGLAKVGFKEKDGIVDKKGRIIVKHEYDRIESFSEGLAVVQNGTKYGYIDKHGNTVMRPHYEKAYSFKDGLALVYISKSDQTERDVKYFGDKIVITYTEPEMWKDGVWGYIDKKGNMVYSFECKNTRHKFPTPSAKEGSNGSFILGVDTLR